MEGELGRYLGMRTGRDRVKRTITISQPGVERLREELGISMMHKPREQQFGTNPLDAAGIKLYQRQVG